MFVKTLTMKNWLFIGAVVWFFTSCKKSTDDNTITKERLTGSYKLNSITMKVGSSAEQNVTDNYLTACEKDDITKLNSDNTYEYMDAGITCNPPGNATGIWDLPSQTTFKQDNEVFDLDRFDGQILQISQTQVQFGQTVKTTITMQKL